MNTTRRQFLGGTAGVATLAAAGGRPNLLLLFPDQWRPDWGGWNGNLDVRTPNLNTLRKRGIEFTRATVASPLCAPSRACLASGRAYERCGVINNGQDYPLDQPTFYTLLRESGYHTMACGKIDLHKKTLDWGVDGKRSTGDWGFSDAIDNAGKRDAPRSARDGQPKDPYMAMLRKRGLMQTHIDDFAHREEYKDTNPTPLPDDAYCDNWIGQNGLDLLRRAPSGKPWFLQVNFTGPHGPMDITRAMEKRVRGRKFPGPFRSHQYDAAIHNAIRENYTAMCENLDLWVGRYLEELRKRGELDNTIVIFSSDHGEMLGDHNRWGKTVPYWQSAGVPMIAAGPGIKAGVRSAELASILDFGATFLDYGGVARPASMDSRSLRGLFEGKVKRHRECATSGLNDWRMAWDGRYKLVTGFDPAASGKQAGPGTPLLFDLAEDREEANNLHAARPELVRKLAEMLHG
ncbi:MAG: sulfatase-like hydrolase/transferase [Bryobacteraceae bacterium]